MEKNTILAIVLSFFIILIYYTFFVPSPKKEEEKPRPPVELPEVKPAPKEELPPVPLVELPPAERKRITVETENMVILFDSQGAAPVSWKLKGYLDKLGKTGRPVEMIQLDPGASDPLPLALALGQKEAASEAPRYHTQGENLFLDRPGQKGELAFTWQSPQGLEVTKAYTFAAEEFKVSLALYLTNAGTRPWSGQPGVTLTRGLVKLDEKEVPLGYVAHLDGSIKRESMKKPGQETLAGEKLKWFGIDEQYFLASLLPQPEGPYQVEVERKANGLLVARLLSPNITLAPGETKKLDFLLFFGPKDLKLLGSLGTQLDRALNFGWFGFIGKPLLVALRGLNRVAGNYGWAIILLTLAIKIVFWPLTEKSFRSMQKMQKIQPYMAQLREKYKNDKARMNREVMDLYRRYKINPVSGCLPLLIQLPILYALYSTLMTAIEIRHAPFVLWIQDLSAKDPTYITPILMGGTMFLQQKMTPTMGDPMQAKMMLMMPVIFTVMFINFPSGLVLYWLVNNVLSIGQQYYTNRRMATTAEPQPPKPAQDKG